MTILITILAIIGVVLCAYKVAEIQDERECRYWDNELNDDFFNN